MTHADEHELLDLATKVAAEAAPGEQVEAFVGSSTTTSVRVHGGEVESLTQATTSGIGVRVVRDGRQGFAYAGSLDPDVVAGVLAEARDNAAYAEPEEWIGLAEPDGVEPPEVELWRDELAAMPADRKVALALELTLHVLAADAKRMHLYLEMHDGDGNLLAWNEQVQLHVSRASGLPKAAAFPEDIAARIKEAAQKAPAIPPLAHIEKRIGLGK